ncbi:hypothetical protein N7501_009539, partial [Penicillium viridicatum]
GPLASGTEREHTTHERHDKGSDNPSDSDYDEGDTVLARGWPRHHHNLAKHGFRPVWTSQNGYPGDEIPEDIQEWLDENGQCKTAQMIGPLRSLAWLAGLDELVGAIDNPAYLIQDDIEVIAFGFWLRDKLIVAIRATYGRRNPSKQNLDQGLGQQSPSHTLIPSNNSSSHHASSCQIYAEYPQL